MIEMITMTELDWHTENQRHVLAALRRVRTQLERHLDSTHESVEESAIEWRLEQPPALETLCAAFNLSPFERDVLLLCAGVEVDASFANLCAVTQGSPEGASPTFGLALAALSDGHWSALSPGATLRRWRLIEVGAGPVLTTNSLYIDERILHHLTGTPYLDQRLAPYLTLVPPPLRASHAATVGRLVRAWTHSEAGMAPVIALVGGSPADRELFAATACTRLELDLWRVDAAQLPVAAPDLDAWLRLWEREAALWPAVLLVDAKNLDGDIATRLADRTGSPLIVSGPERFAATRPTVTISLGRTGGEEQRAVWEGLLGEHGFALADGLEALVEQFTLDTGMIRDVVGAALLEDEQDLGPSLWNACRLHTRPRMDGLARRIETVFTSNDLVLPPTQMEMLREIATHVRRRAIVYERWGWAARGDRGLGITALFAGASGTGKTLAAEVLAHELALDLYVIDLSQVVSKYIGETEKNLARVFDAAEAGGAVLLFDEADALFGKRSEVKDSHDRYANIEVSYLLQRMEMYRGLAILTTNMKSALDSAFLRRLRFVVQFPFPDAPQRAEIWRRVFPPATPLADLNLDNLARMNITGGNIRNIALHATFLAADTGSPVGMGHLLRAARSEYAKLEKPLTEAEIGGWG